MANRSGVHSWLLWVLRAACAAAPLCLSSGAAMPNPPEPIRIGLILSLSGAAEDISNSALIGAQVAVAEINAVGGYLGRPVELVIHDDQGNPDAGYKAAQDILQRAGAVGTVGVCDTAVGVRVADYYQANSHPFIVSCATGVTITSKYPPASSYVFRTSADSQLQVRFLVDELKKSTMRKVALLVDNTPYGDIALSDLQAAMERVGLKPRTVVRFDVNVKNLDKEILALKAAGIDGLVSCTLGTEHGVIAASRAAAHWSVPLLGDWNMSSASAYVASGGKVEGVEMVQTVVPNRRLQRNSAFLTAYAKRSQEHLMGSMMSAAQTYDAVQLLARALFATKGEFTGPAIKNALENSNEVYRGVVTNYDHPFSRTDHDAITANMLWLGTWRNGDRAYYYEADEKRAFVIRKKAG